MALLSPLMLPSSAMAADKPFVMMGVGTATCGDFAREYQQIGTQLEATYFAWAQGFMSAVNIAKMRQSSSFKDLHAWSVDQEEAHIRGYCDQHPLGDYEDAVLDLLLNLPDRPVDQ